RLAGDAEHVRRYAGAEVVSGVHAGLEARVGPRELDGHGDHGDVLLDDRLRVDAADLAGHRQVGVGVELDADALPLANLADVGFVDVADHPEPGDVADLDEGAGAAEGLPAARDDGPLLDALGSDHPVARRQDLGVTEVRLRLPDGGLVADDLRLGGDHVLLLR